MKNMKPSIGKYYKLPNPGLWAYFKHNVSGQPEDYRPPFWKGKDRSTVLQLWQHELDASGLKKDLPDLYSFEMDMKSKVGPMSIQLPLDERIESIEQYFTCIKNPGEPIAHEAIVAASKFFAPAGGVRLRSYQNVLQEMRLSTNSGSPYFTKRRLVVNDTLGDIPLTYSNNHLITKSGDFELVATLGWRGQEGGIEDVDVKQRVVWMMPMALNVHELRFYQPAIKAIQSRELIPAYVSMDRVDQEVTALFDTKDENDLVICTDFTKFDQHFNKHLQEAAREIEQSLVTKGYTPNDWLFDVKFHIPLVCSPNLMYVGEHGMGSGAGGTSFDECMAHKALQYEVAIENGAILNPHSMAYGDDGVLTYKGITVEQVVRAYTRHGQEMNTTKQYASKHDCVVLRRWHGTEYRVNGTMVGVYSTFRALGRLLAQERYYDPEKWSKEMVTLRALSIIENCKWHPHFHKFIDFVLKGDKFKLGLEITGFYENLDSIAQKAIESGIDILGYTKSLQQSSKSTLGINDWEVVKYLRSKIKK
nr:MAG: RNA-dependent RNA polymerase [nabpantry virus 13]